MCNEADMLLRVLGGMDADESNNSIPGCAASLADATAPLRDRALTLRTAQRNLEAVAQVADALVEHLSACRRLSPRVASAAVTFPGPGSPRLMAGRRRQQNAMLLLLRDDADEDGDDNNLAASQMAAESFVSDVERLGQACLSLLQPLSTTTTTTTRRRRHSSTTSHQQSAAATIEAARPVVVQALSALEQGRARLAEELAAALAALSLSSPLPPQPQPPPLLLRRAAAVLLQHEMLLLVSRPTMTAEDKQQQDYLPPSLRRFRSKSSAAAAAQRSTLVSRCGAARASALAAAMREGDTKSTTTRRLPSLALAWRVAQASAAAAEASGLRAAVEAVMVCGADSTPAIDRYYAAASTSAASRPTSVSFASLDAVSAGAGAEADDDNSDDDNHTTHLPPLPPAPSALLLPLPGALARCDPSTDAVLSSAAAAWLRDLDALGTLLPAERALADAVFCSSVPLPPSPSSITTNSYASASSTTAAAAASCAAAAAIGALSSLAQQGHALVAALRRAGHDRAAPLLVDVACALEARLPVIEAAVRAAVVKRGGGGGGAGEDYGGGDGESSDGGGSSSGGGGGGGYRGASTDEEEDEEDDNHHRHHNRVRVSYFDDAGAGDNDDHNPPPTAAAQASLADLRAVQKQAERAAGEVFRGYEAALLAAGAAAACCGCDTLFLPLAADGSVHPLAADAARYARALLFQTNKTTTTTPPGGAAAVLFGGGAGAAFAPLPSTAAAAAQRELLERKAATMAARRARGGGSGSGDDEDEDEEKQEQHDDDPSRSQPLPPHERALADAFGRLLHAALAALEAKARAFYGAASSSSSAASRHALAALFLANNAAVLLAAGEPEEEGQRGPPPPSWTSLQLEADAHAEAFHRALWGPALQALEEEGQDTTLTNFFARVDEAIQMQRSWVAVEHAGLRERLVRRAREELKGALRAAVGDDEKLQRQLEQRLDAAALLSSGSA